MIRAAQPGDYPGIRTLLRLCSLPSDDLPEPGGNAEFFVSEEDGKLNGVVGVEYYGTTGPTALLRSAAVVRRSAGIGSALVETAIAAARRRNCAEIVLLTETAGRWFARFGFVMIERDSVGDGVKRSGQFSGSTCTSAAVMRLVLRPEPGKL